eukprot:scaffold26100_cov120-Isochrysis_galbana.AAC.1
MCGRSRGAGISQGFEPPAALRAYEIGYKLQGEPASSAADRVDARVDDARDCEDAAHDCAERGEEVGEGGPLLGEGDHDGRDVIDEEDAGEDVALHRAV